jgi:hypothetical protein
MLHKYRICCVDGADSLFSNWHFPSFSLLFAFPGDHKLWIQHVHPLVLRYLALFEHTLGDKNITRQRARCMLTMDNRVERWQAAQKPQTASFNGAVGMFRLLCSIHARLSFAISSCRGSDLAEHKSTCISNKYSFRERDSGSAYYFRLVVSDFPSFC